MKARGVPKSEPQPVDPEILASFDRPQKFEATVRLEPSMKAKTYTTVDTLQGVMTRAAAKFGGKGGDWRTYEAEKGAWLRAHPEATEEEYTAACRAIAKRMGL
jgi:hypothetical protein